MPNYIYGCNDCESKFSIWHKMTDDPEIECSACKSKNVRKMITGGTGVSFKGSGFYCNDYKNKEGT